MIECGAVVIGEQPATVRVYRDRNGDLVGRDNRQSGTQCGLEPVPWIGLLEPDQVISRWITANHRPEPGPIGDRLAGDRTSLRSEPAIHPGVDRLRPLR